MILQDDGTNPHFLAPEEITALAGAGGQPRTGAAAGRLLRVLARLQLAGLKQRIDEVKSKLQRINPVTDKEEYHRRFSDLLALEQHSRALKEQAIERLSGRGIFTTLTMTAALGGNDAEIGAVVRRALDTPYVGGVSIQPQFGSGRSGPIDWTDRLTHTGVLARPGPAPETPQPLHRIDAWTATTHRRSRAAGRRSGRTSAPGRCRTRASPASTSRTRLHSARARFAQCAAESIACPGRGPSRSSTGN